MIENTSSMKLILATQNTEITISDYKKIHKLKVAFQEGKSHDEECDFLPHYEIAHHNATSKQPPPPQKKKQQN